ncbi:hypothetical protein HZS_2382 [Henneguya salminicola]|uniref:Endoplasmic reticulum vesicle protein 25 (Trinotate prediction) n=1 Tax=Henneguya salminicola TaxID=69463 RepID=A0A6G3ML61_HENSL|nr:hypothetical protein HZS_2382 [Henneguya salminicola]
MGKIFLNASFKSYEEVHKENDETSNNLQLTITGMERVSKFLHSLEENSKNFQTRQDILISQTEKKNQLMVFLNLVTLGVLVGLGFWQFFYLKRYFRDRNML